MLGRRRSSFLVLCGQQSFMRLHGYTLLMRFPGGSLWGHAPGVGAKAGRKVVHPETGRRRWSVRGLIRRITMTGRPLRSGYLRKVAKDTDAQALWGGSSEMGPGVSRHRVLDPEGIFIGDGSYLFVPDNPTMKVGQAPLR